VIDNYLNLSVLFCLCCCLCPHCGELGHKGAKNGIENGPRTRRNSANVKDAHTSKTHTGDRTYVIFIFSWMAQCIQCKPTSRPSSPHAHGKHAHHHRLITLWSRDEMMRGGDRASLLLLYTYASKSKSKSWSQKENALGTQHTTRNN